MKGISKEYSTKLLSLSGYRSGQVRRNWVLFLALEMAGIEKSLCRSKNTEGEQV